MKCQLSVDYERRKEQRLAALGDQPHACRYCGEKRWPSLCLDYAEARDGLPPVTCRGCQVERDEARRAKPSKRKLLDRVTALGCGDFTCIVCGETRRARFELHHMAQKKHAPNLLAIACANCHRVLSDRQRDHGETSPRLTPEGAVDQRTVWALADIEAARAELEAGRAVELDIAVRAYTESAEKEPRRPRERDAKTIARDTPSKWTLVFDTETSGDAAQFLRIGFYQVRDGDALHEEGALYDPDALSPDELETLRAYAHAHGLKLLTRWEFVHEVFYRYGYDRRGTVVGFNLPFDLSRLATRHASARGSLRGGFSFTLSPYPDRPSVRVKHLNRSAALIDFAKPRGKGTVRSARKHGFKVDTPRGFFVDVKTMFRALRSAGGGLADVSRQLHADGNVETVKSESDEHGGPLTAEYLDYGRRDVQATWECFAALREEYAAHRLPTRSHRILSEASIGKAYLEAMGVKPLLERHPDFPRGLFGKVMASYFGGRAEVRWRRTPKRVIYADFKSMYPTVNALMGLWAFVVADGLTWRDGTADVRTFLADATPETLRDPKAWPMLRAIVRRYPSGEVAPVRARYDGAVHTIGQNVLIGSDALWITLPDLVAEKIRTGRTPVIEEAIVFEPGPLQEGLTPIELFGRSEFSVDPTRQDVFKRLVDLRDDAKARKDDVQKAIKIIANAASYGIFVEVNRDDAPDPEPIFVWGPDGARREMMSTAIEQPGKYFNPIIATLITGAARLMLALAERRAVDEGLDWVFCDTDSLAIAKPEWMSEEQFAPRWRAVVDWFETLNPYDKSGSILQVEDENYAPDMDELRPLYALAISAKRYVLYNLDDAGQPIIRKASAHGLGHLRPPYGEKDAPNDIPPPTVPLSRIGVERWQYDLWFKIIEAAYSDAPHQVALDYHPALSRPAVSRYGATSPRLLAWCESYNAGRPYRDRVKPFGFMLTLMGRNGLWTRVREELLATLPGRGRPKTTRPELRPVAPFDKDHETAIANAFDRETGEPIAIDDLMTYAEALARYHLSPESKFANAESFDSGRTERRHVIVKRVRLIGKESNRLDADMPANVLGEDVAEFGEAMPPKPDEAA